MAVVVGTSSANPNGVTASGNVATYSAAGIGTATHDRIVAVVVGGEVALDPNSCTIAGLATTATNLATFGSMRARIFYRHVGNLGGATTADIAVTWSGNPTNVQNHIAVYSITGAQGTASSSGTNTSTDMDSTAPLTTGSTTIAASGGMLAVAVGATDGTGKTWANLTEDLDVDAGDFRFTTAASVTSGTATRTCTGGTNQEDGAMAWIILVANASVEMSPARVDLAFSPTAPTGIVSAFVNISPARVDLAYSSSAPSISLTANVVASPARVDLAYSSAAPSRVIGFNYNPARVDLAYSSSAPSVVTSDHKDITPAHGDAVLSFTAPSSSIGYNFVPDRADLALSFTAPSVDASASGAISPSRADLVLSSVAPIVAQTANIVLPTVSGDIAFSSAAPSLVLTANASPVLIAAQLAFSTSAPAVENSGQGAMDIAPFMYRRRRLANGYRGRR